MGEVGPPKGEAGLSCWGEGSLATSSAHGQGSATACWGCLVLIATCCTLQILGYFDYAFTAIFTVEILLKVTRFSLTSSANAAAAVMGAFFACLPGARLCRLCLHGHFCV